MTKSEDARTARSGSRCTRLVERGTPRTVRCAAFFVRSENSSALVGDGLLRFELPGQLRVLTLYALGAVFLGFRNIWGLYRFPMVSQTPYMIV